MKARKNTTAELKDLIRRQAAFLSWCPICESWILPGNSDHKPTCRVREIIEEEAE